ncbi:PAS domain-containing protein [Aestuariicoccus sp. MJ-SS9]|uniref:PAS domain-containing protein n=1 Tax=Aestuariicoccus sp. MJ-SS9 TaxID=3079855 RepID=UPI00290C749C|nr:PAS domain-containing protein [Aestuariicoccus sp. MJ-SS9]MDU8912103.1 PAS domain-containing protein [Aestuariicoccus sp. MJ-SS9]
MFRRGEHGVVSMNARGLDRAMAPLRLVESYWLGLREGSDVPLRSVIDPRGMEDALENAFLAERLGPSLAKIRVAGSHLNDLMGMEVGGMPLSALFTPAARNRLSEAIPRLFGDPAILRITLRGEAGFGRPALDGALLLLPLRSDMNDVTRALGCLATHGDIGRTPRRFDITGVEITHALGDLVPDEAAEAFQDRSNASPGLAEDAAPFAHAPAEPGKPHLRIVVSNDD